MMRAKMKVSHVTSYVDGVEHLTMTAVGKDDCYPADGSDENNTFAAFTPSADLSMLVNNPALQGKIKEGDVFYVDFTKVL